MEKKYLWRELLLILSLHEEAVLLGNSVFTSQCLSIGVSSSPKKTYLKSVKKLGGWALICGEILE